MELVSKKKLTSPNLVGPIAEGETPEQAVARMEKTFGRRVTRYAFKMHKVPMRGRAGVDQMFDVIVGTAWAS